MLEETFITQRDDALAAECKAVSDEYAPRISPREKNAFDMLEYIKRRYPTVEETSAELKCVVAQNARDRNELLPDGILDKGADVVVLRVRNEGSGKVLYERQPGDYKALMKQIRQTMPDIEDFTEFPIQIIVGVEKHSGFVYTEGSPTLSEEILMLQGLNEKECSNAFLVANYVRILEKYDRLDLLDL